MSAHFSYTYTEEHYFFDAPAQASNTVTLTHNQSCATVFLRSVYDKSCPRCNKINIAIQLSRKTMANGCAMNEALAAQATLQVIVRKFGLRPAELVDRLYASVTNKITQPSEATRKARKRGPQIIDQEDSI